MTDASSGGEKQGWFGRLRQGLSRSSTKLSEGITGIFTKRKLDQATLDELEELLIRADLGAGTAAKLVDAFGKTRFGQEIAPEEVKSALALEIAKILEPVAQPLTRDREAKRRAGGRCERQRQDHDDRQAGAALSR